MFPACTRPRDVDCLSGVRSGKSAQQDSHLHARGQRGLSASCLRFTMSGCCHGGGSEIGLTTIALAGPRPWTSARGAPSTASPKLNRRPRIVGFPGFAPGSPSPMRGVLDHRVIPTHRSCLGLRVAISRGRLLNDQPVHEKRGRDGRAPHPSQTRLHGACLPHSRRSTTTALPGLVRFMTRRCARFDRTRASPLDWLLSGPVGCRVFVSCCRFVVAASSDPSCWE